MLFPFIWHQLQPEKPTVSSTARRASENGHADIGPSMRLQVVSDVSSNMPSPVITVKESYRCAAKKT
jgi:hypothetical protein